MKHSVTNTIGGLGMSAMAKLLLVPGVSDYVNGGSFPAGVKLSSEEWAMAEMARTIQTLARKANEGMSDAHIGIFAKTLTEATPF